LESPTWHELTARKLDTYSASTIKSFLRKEAINQRTTFKQHTLPIAPGVAAVVDEWSDLQMIPWMGIVVAVVDLDFNFSLHSPGMQLVDQAPSAENLLLWFIAQISRLGICCEDLSNVCMDNASNISKAAALDPHLSKKVSFCICHLINIAVKRATMEPISATGSQEYDGNDDIMLEEAVSLNPSDVVEASNVPDHETTSEKHTARSSARRKTSKYWYYEVVEDESEQTPGENQVSSVSSVSGKRTKVPSQLFQQFLSGEVVTGAHLDVANESDDAIIAADELDFMRTQWPQYSTNTLSARNVVIERLGRCKEIVKHIKLHQGPRRAFDDIRKKLADTAEIEYQVQLKQFRDKQEDYKKQMASYQERLSSLPEDEDAPLPPAKPLDQKPERPIVPIGLVSEVETRWNSLLACVCSVIGNSEALEQLWDKGNGDGIPLFDENEWIQLENLAQYLIRFERLTIHVQGDQILASEALIAVKEFVALVKVDHEDSELVASMKRAIRAHMENHRAKLSRILSYLKPDSLAAFCACVDPRAIDLSVFPKSQRGEVRSNFLTYAVHTVNQWNARLRRYNEQTMSPELQRKASKTVSEKQPSVTGSRSLSFSNFMTDDASSSSDDNDMRADLQSLESDELLRHILSKEITSFATECNEFGNYMEEHEVKTLLEETKAVFSWWRSIAGKYPNLRIVASKLFSVRISSASAERMFSLAGLVRTARRNRMSAGLFDSLIAYSYNDVMLRQHRVTKADKRLSAKQSCKDS
jgi:hypothetical protein